MNAGPASRRSRKARCAMSATMSPSSSPRPWRRRATPPRRSKSITRCCRLWSTSPMRNRARRFTMSRQTMSSTTGISATKTAVDKAFASAKHVTKLELINNGWCRIRWSRAPPSANMRKARTRSCFTRRARIRMSRGWFSQRLSGLHPNTSSASSRPMSAAASARKSSSMRKRRSASGRRGRSTARSNGIAIAPKRFSATRMAAITSPMRNSRPTPMARSRRCASPRKPISALISRPSASSVPTYLYAPLLSGQYNIPAIYAEVMALYTNTAPVDAYRGAGRPEATFVIERIVEIAARELGMDPAEFRRKNFVTSFPHQTPVIMCYDTGDYDASLKKAQEIHDTAGFAKRKAESEFEGQTARPRLFRLHRGVRYRALGRGRFARRRRRLMGIGRSAGQSDRHGGNSDGIAFARAGARDDIRATRLRPARHPDRQCLHRAWRYRQSADGHGHVWLALRRGRHVGHRQSARQDRGKGEESRCARARSARGRHRVQGRQVHRQRYRQERRLGHDRAAGLCRA